MGDITEDPGQPAEVAPVAATPLDELRAEITKELEEPRLFKRFPRGTGRLVGEYRPSKKKEVREAAAAENDEYLLAECLVRILIHDPDRADPETPEGKVGLVALGRWSGRPELDPLRFDNRLCELIGLPQSGDPKRISLELFNLNDLQLADVAGQVAEWSLSTAKVAFQDFTTAS